MRTLMMSTAAVLTLACAAHAAEPGPGDWPNYGRDPGGQRFSPLADITPENVVNLKPAWVYHMRPEGDTAAPAGPAGGRPDRIEQAQRTAEGVAPVRRPSRFGGSEATPLVVDGMMYLTTPYHRVVALEPATGKEVWSYEVPGPGQPSLRGVAYWPGDETHPPEILFGTRDHLLIALDARTGKPVERFGEKGIVELRTPEIMNGVQPTGFSGAVGMTSPPVVYKNLVITGSAVQEFPTLGPAGDVRAWDVRTGKLVWTFHTVPRPGEFGHDTWAGDSWKQRSGTNVWGQMTVDGQRGVVYLPIGAPTWDRYGGDRKGDNLFGTSVVAVDAATGRRLWHFQIVHHDIWDFDAESAPVLFDVHRNGQAIPAVGFVSKSSLMFILNRVTGKPIYPVSERPVPPSEVPGEQASPTQPFPAKPEPLARITMSKADLATVTPELEAYCRKLVEDNQITLGGPFLPVGRKVTVNFPGTLGGPNWGGASFDPKLGYFFVNIQNLGQMELLVPGDRGGLPVQMGSPTGRFWKPDQRLPCQQPPWGQLVAVNVNTGEIAWRSTLGVTDSLPEGKRDTGRPNLGGSIATASGLVFIGATDDDRFRAFSAKTGKELWTWKLDASAHATPITFRGRDGRQYVAVTSTGGTFLDSPVTSDTVTAFALPKD